MDCIGNQNVNNPADCEIDAAVVSCEESLPDCYVAQAIKLAAQRDAGLQIEREAETRSIDPQAYRLSSMSQAAVNGCYRRGKDTMSSEDVLRYFSEIRNQRLVEADFDGNTGIDECESDPITKRSLMIVENTPHKMRTFKQLGAVAVAVKDQFWASRRMWLDSSRPDASKEGRRFPLSALAALVAVAMSMMLIVASSILVTSGENGVNDLKKEIDLTSAEYAKLRSDFEVQNDLLEIRRIAVEEYGMVSKDFLKSDQIELASEDTVESFEEKQEERVGFSALLSAIGIK